MFNHFALLYSRMAVASRSLIMDHADAEALALAAVRIVVNGRAIIKMARKAAAAAVIARVLAALSGTRLVDAGVVDVAVVAAAIAVAAVGEAGVIVAVAVASAVAVAAIVAVAADSDAVVVDVAAADLATNRLIQRRNKIRK